jgi:hypothetical protein
MSVGTGLSSHFAQVHTLFDTLELWFEAIVNKFDILMPFTEGPQDDQDSTKCHTHTI